MNAKNLILLVVLSTGMLTGLAVTTIAFATPAFASKKHCEDNGDNNCNSTHNTQKIKVKNECEIENYNKDHSKDNSNENALDCISQNANVRDAVLVNSSIFGDPFTQ